MICKEITYKLYAIEQMFNRSITQIKVKAVIEFGETIAAYPNDKPSPSILRLAFINRRPIHVVIAQSIAGECCIITAYEPDIFLWESDFKTKKR